MDQEESKVKDMLSQKVKSFKADRAKGANVLKQVRFFATALNFSGFPFGQNLFR